MDDLRFNALDCFYVKGRGFAFSGLNPVETNRQGLSNRYVGKTVTIDGRGYGDSFLVIGVESRAVDHQPAGAPISLLVDTKRPIES